MIAFPCTAGTAQARPRTARYNALSAANKEGEPRMKRYEPRPGIVHTKICGIHVLIPSREAFGQCATIQRLPILWAITWDAICDPSIFDRALQIHRVLTKKPDEEILRQIDRFCMALCEKGFLIERPDESAAASGSPDARPEKTGQEEQP